MLALQEVKQAIDQLSPEELRAGLTQQELDEMTDAMNAEYIEPVDDDQWKD